jgi:hypothetical protein
MKKCSVAPAARASYPERAGVKQTDHHSNEDFDKTR